MTRKKKKWREKNAKISKSVYVKMCMSVCAPVLKSAYHTVNSILGIVVESSLARAELVCLVFLFPLFNIICLVSAFYFYRC